MRKALLGSTFAALLAGTGLLAQGVGLPASPASPQSGLGGTLEIRTQSDGTAEPRREAPPLLRIDFPETEAIPGQFLALRLTILVPSFMPEPPVWPSFEAPNLLVRLPERATSPTSETIDGETWSGISRRYLLSPMIPGRFEIPPQDVVVTWAGAAAAGPNRAALTTGPIAFSGVLPEGAEGLDPFIAASDVTLTQNIVGEPGAMVPGDSFRRTLSAEVAGVSPMFLPDLLAPSSVPGLAAYPDEPRIDETDERGTLGGTRSESVTYVAESGGGGTLPEVALRWFDVGAGTIETARVAAIEIAVDGPPAVLAEPADRERLAMIAAIGLILAVVVAFVLRRALPPLRRLIAARRAAVRSSEAHAWRALRGVIARRDHAALHRALDTWAARAEGPDPRRDDAVQSALAALGSCRYGPRKAPADIEKDAWRRLATSLGAARRSAPSTRTRSALPPLNPGVSA